MSCRSTPANSAATTFARLNSELSDVQTLSAFHVLRAEAGRAAEAPTATDWQTYLATERAFVTGHPNLTEARRRSLLRRLDSALKQPLPDGPTWTALRRIRSFTQVQSRELNARYQALADRLGQDVDTIRARAAHLAGQVDTARDAEPPLGYTDVTLRAFRQARLPVDRQSVHALVTLQRQADEAAASAQPHTLANRRITRQAVESAAVCEVGYDPDGGRLEVVFNSNPERVYAYRNVPAHVFEEMTTGSAGRAWHRHLRNAAFLRYPDQASMEADAYRQQCTGCGQFTGSGHVCPTRLSAQGTPHEQALAAAQAVAALGQMQRPSTSASVVDQRQVEPRSIAEVERVAVIDPDGTTTSLPETPVLVEATRTGPVAVPVRHFGASASAAGLDPAVIGGSLVVLREQDGSLGVDLRQVRCICAAYARAGRCEHVDGYGRAALRRINPQAAQVEDVRAAQQAAEEALAQDWMRSNHFAAEARKRWAVGAAVNYSQDFTAFEEAGQRALRSQAAGIAPLPFMREDATDGMLSPQSGRGFGVEIEFDFPESMSDHQRTSMLREIGLELYERGLTSHAYQRDYHAAEDSGYSDQREGGWSFEEDGTVAGEVVSPILYDTPESWADLATVCEVVRTYGGVATARTGSHVHIGAGSYGPDPASHTELARMVNQHEDVIYRLAQNPDARGGAHRPLGYCAPNPEVPLAGYRSIASAVNDHSGHDQGLNLAAVDGGRGDHIEFRQWDATLDPAVIQTQVKVSAAMTVAAQRIAAENGSTARPREPLGAHWARNQHLLAGSRRQLSTEERQADTATARSFIDTLFTRTEDKEQVARLFAVTRWQRRTWSAVADEHEGAEPTF